MEAERKFRVGVIDVLGGCVLGGGGVGGLILRAGSKAKWEILSDRAARLKETSYDASEPWDLGIYAEISTLLLCNDMRRQVVRLSFPPPFPIFFLYPLYPTLPLLLRRSSVSGPTNFRNYETVSLKWRLEINPWKKRFLLVATLFSSLSLSLFLSPFFLSLFLISTFILLLNFARCEERSVGW